MVFINYVVWLLGLCKFVECSFFRCGWQKMTVINVNEKYQCKNVYKHIHLCALYAKTKTRNLGKYAPSGSLRIHFTS